MEDIWPRQDELGLLTDLYELTMQQAYHAEGMQEQACFSLFFRKLPGHRNFILACGQEHAAHIISELRFPEEQVRRLASLEMFDDDFLARLRDFRFSGDVHAVPEGTPVFPHEPIMEVTAPVGEAQLLESFIMNFVNLETLLASKAIRMVLAAGDRPVVDFGMRRMHGLEAALRSVRAYRAAGLAGTSNVLGSLRYGLPARGTMAHSYIQAHDDEMEAFRTYARLYPGTTLLVDTYDSTAGIDKVIRLVREEGLEVGAIRLDSGDLAAEAKAARRQLDEAGLKDIKVLVSGGLDEWAIDALVRDDAPVDGFGVGTEMGSVADAPSLDFAYKLTEYAGKPRLKNSPGKQLYPARKQVWRYVDGNGVCTGDEITQRDEARHGMPLLRPVVSSGFPVAPLPDINATHRHVQQSLQALPAALRQLEPAEPYPVSFSDRLVEMRQEVLQSLNP